MSLLDSQRLEQQLRFITELDQLKQVLRQTSLVDGSRRENSAEHSWHLALMAVVLLEYAPAGTDLTRVLKMLVLHDVVEIEAGDTFCYDAQANLNKAAREQAAATHIFGLLPGDLNAQLRELGKSSRRERQAKPALPTHSTACNPFCTTFTPGAAHGGRITPARIRCLGECVP